MTDFTPDVIDVTLVTDTAAYADNDVLVVPQAITGFFNKNRITKLKEIRLLDEADQAQDLDIIFMSATGTLGTINGAFNPTDAVAQTILATIRIVAADYDDYINSQIATKREINALLRGADDATSVWIAAACRGGTPTYAASSLKLKLGVERY
jgi:hypothetical protein